jgi:hypothetical protein
MGNVQPINCISRKMSANPDVANKTRWYERVSVAAFGTTGEEVQSV